MTESVKEIFINQIDPSPYQHRRYFAKAKLNELANSIKRDGLIEPIVVRPQNGRYELIAGERRWRAAQVAELDSLIARIIEVSDLQARRMCAAENLQREDLSIAEETEAIVEIIDAELGEYPDYLELGDRPITRVYSLLAMGDSIESGQRQGNRQRVSSELNHKIFDKLIEDFVRIFTNLPKPKKWQSFLANDLRPYLNTDEDVKQIAAKLKANKTQMKAYQKLKRNAPETFDKLRKDIEQAEEQQQDFEDVTIQTGALGNESISITEASARDIEQAAQSGLPLLDMAIHYSSETPEWYTPQNIVKRVVSVLGEISLDPCSNSLTFPNVPALKHYTKETNGLNKSWGGKIYMNPPYGDEIIHWVTKLKSEYEIGNVTEAIALVPARTDTAWFKLLRIYPRCFITGRLRFSRVLEGAPFPSVVIYLGDRLKDFAKSFEDIGDVYILYQEQE